MSLSGITFGGLASGIDTESIISRLMQLEQIPIQRLQSRQAQILSNKNVYSQMRSQLTSLRSAASALTNSSTYETMKGTSSDPTTATVTATSSVASGTHTLKVTQLAQANRISTKGFATPTTALGLSGKFQVGAISIDVAAEDTLTTLAAKINDSEADVTAAVVNGGTNNAFLSITANSTGVANAVTISEGNTYDLTRALGLVNYTPTGFRNAVSPNGFQSNAISSDTDTFGSLFGTSGSKSFTINGQNIAIDDTMNLNDMASAINAANANVNATVVTDGSDFRLKIMATNGTDPTVVDTDGFLQTIGAIGQYHTNEVIAAKDANYVLDGITLSSSINTVTDVIPGATFNFLKENTSEISLSFGRDTDAITNQIKNYKDAINAVNNFVQANSSFNAETYSSGPLFGDFTASRVVADLSSMVLTSVGGLDTSLTNLTQIGFGYDDKGNVTLDETVLKNALADSPTGVAALMRAIGSTTGSGFSYISSSEKTKATSTGYTVNITQLATLGAATATDAQTGALGTTEKLTFTGTMFGANGFELTLGQGLTQQQVVDQINNNSTLKNLVTATVTSGKLVLTSKKYGTPGNFSVKSDQTAGANSTGIGTESLAATGLNVAGTIGGEAATGNGQVLTGDSGNANTDGLQIMVTGGSTGNIGTVKFTKGVAQGMIDMLSTYTDSVNGLLTTNDNSLQAQYDDLDASIIDLTQRIKLKEVALRQRFAAMESAIASFNAQSARLTQLMGTSSS